MKVGVCSYVYVMATKPQQYPWDIIWLRQSGVCLQTQTSAIYTIYVNYIYILNYRLEQLHQSSYVAIEVSMYTSLECMVWLLVKGWQGWIVKRYLSVSD